MPKINGVQIDLFILFNEISSRGGYRKVVLHNKWPEIAESLGLSGTSLGMDNYLRQIYNRYLFPLEGKNGKDSFLRKDVDLFFTLPSTYNYNFLYLDNAKRLQHDLPELTNVINPSFHLELSFLSGVPSSVDFALNCCLLMTHDVPLPRVDLNKCRQLLDLILAWLAFNQDRSFDPIFAQHWHSYSFLPFPLFWATTTLHFSSINSLLVTGDWPSVSPHRLGKSQLIFTVNILTILHNAIFDDLNSLLVTRHENLIRLFLFASFNTHKQIREIALSAIEIASHRLILPQGPVAFAFDLLLRTCLDFNTCSLPDVVKGLQIGAGLCASRQNLEFIESVFTRDMLEGVYEGFMARKKNMAVLLNGLDFFRALFLISAEITEISAEIENSIDCFLELLVVDREWLCSCDFGNLTFGQQQIRFVHEEPRRVPQETGLFDCHNVVKVRRWLLSTFRLVEGGRMSVAKVFKRYLSFCVESYVLSLPSHIFAGFVWSVFPQIHLSRDEGLFFVGLGEFKRDTFRVASPELMDTLLAEKIKNDQFIINRVVNSNGSSRSPKVPKHEECIDNPPPSEDSFDLSEILEPKDPHSHPYTCWWERCGQRFSETSALGSHVVSDHIGGLEEGCCPWTDCSLVYYRKWALVGHILDNHSPEATPQTPSDHLLESDTVGDNPWGSEDDLVKHIRMQSAYILRSWCVSSPVTLRMVRRFESVLCDMMLSGCDCRKVLADCLYSLQVDDD